MKGGERQMMRNFLKNFTHTVENKGESLVITVKGEKEKIAGLEKKLKAIKELCCGEDGCCGDHGCC